ncbi:nitrile hydratase subunit beta [Actinomycetospora endophytica]|uniref:nitrile hydratase n=1 Tax=Actinomycetospora endophytica TaxID=2291215 RepID=A0ABS8P8F3_9PSEU|nr:nitrile hydratase subunit beta [Actinomycetospora endophytica]MCD2194389.1 nitrile hydratase subunit beta [Actinomycetospora endophytica]
MDSIADMGGVLGYGPASRPMADEPPFAEPWEGRAFAMTVLAMGRISGRNLDAFRHALERLSPLDYLADGYYGRWLNAAELMLVESAVLAPGAVDTRVRRDRGEDVAEPAFPEPRKPEYAPSAPGSLREVADPPRLAVGQAVVTADVHPRGPSKLPAYLRRRRGTVTAVRPAHVLPDTHGVFVGENPQQVYTVGFDSAELWGPDAEPFRLHADLFDSYLAAVTGTEDS